MFDGLFARGRVSAFEPGYGDGLAGRPEDLKLAPLEVVRVDRETLAQLPAEEVYIVDRSKVSMNLDVKFYRLMIPDIPVGDPDSDPRRIVDGKSH